MKYCLLVFYAFKAAYSARLIPIFTSVAYLLPKTSGKFQFL
jgi:hypothetical protein